MKTPHKQITNFNEVIEILREYPLKKVAVSVAQSSSALEAVAKAFALGIAEPVLFGDENQIKKIIKEKDLELEEAHIHHFDNYLDAANAAAKFVGEGSAHMLMKGQIHSDDFLRTIIKRDHNLMHSGKILSHVFVLEAETLGRLLLVTDGAVNIEPDLEKKALIAANAIFLSHVLGVEKPNVAVLGAVELVNPKMPTTLEAAALSKMCERKQIKFGMIDGPYALDNAVSVRAAQVKKINHPMAGHADIILVPNLEVGNCLSKSFVYLAGGTIAGVVLGAKVPVILPSRADTPRSKLMGIALGVLISDMVEEKFVKLGKVHI